MGDAPVDGTDAASSERLDVVTREIRNILGACSDEGGVRAPDHPRAATQH
jgi:hypothetical protein